METTVLTKSEALKKKAKGKKGFTLVELVVVIAVLAIIAVIAVPMVSGVVKNANESADKSNAQSLEVTLKSAAAQVQAGTAPTTPTAIGSGTSVDAVLAAYGTSGGVPACKQSNFKFWYKKDGGIVAATTAPDTNYAELVGSTVTLGAVYTCS